MDVTDSVCERIPTLLEEERYQEALCLGKAPENQAELTEQAWDLVPHLCCPLTSDNECYKPELILTCEALLLHLAEICNSKELLLSLLEQVDCFKEDVKLIVLLPAIQRCLLRIGAKKFLSLAMCFQNIYPHLLTIDRPQWSSFDGKERLLLSLDKSVERSNNVLRALTGFLKPFVEEMALKNHTEESRTANRKQIREIVLFLVKLLDRPLAYLDLTYDPESEENTKAKSTSRYLAERVVDMINSMEGDSMRLVVECLDENERLEALRKRTEKLKAETFGVYDELEEFDEDKMVPVLGLATFAYLVYGENMVSEISPLVLTSEYHLEQVCFALTLLLPSPYHLVSEKGVKLLNSILSRIQPFSLSVYYLEREDFRASLDCLLTLVCRGQIQTISRLAVNVVTRLFDSFTHQGRHRFLLTLFNKYKHSGLISYAVSLLQKTLYHQLDNDAVDVHFRGKHLDALLKHVFDLPSAEESDLLEKSEPIMSALNVLRYLVIRDTANVTGIWDQMDTIQTAYLETLHKGLQISRAHYQLSLDQLKAGKGGISVDLSVSGEGMPGMSLDQQKNMVGMALSTFDMMESVVSRVGELIEQNNKARDMAAKMDVV